MVWFNSYLYLCFLTQLKNAAEEVIFAKEILVVSTEFTCYAMKYKYKIIDTLTCETKYTIYLIAYKCCSKQDIGSANGFMERL